MRLCGLAKREELMIDLAKLPTADIKANNEMLNRYKNLAPDVKSLKTVLPMLLAPVDQLHEFNPMLAAFFRYCITFSVVPRGHRTTPVREARSA